ncbi:FILTED domain-containing surface protein, partial [Holdemania filiformis]
IPMEATDETYTAQYFEDKNHSGKDDEDEKVTIIFRAGANGSLNTGDITIEDVLIGTHFGDAVKTIPTPIANNGYHFTAWNNPIPANEAEVVGDMEFVANFAANQTDPDPVNPGCPAGTEWNEEAQACLAPVVPPVPVPPGPGPVNPEPQPEEEIIVEPTTPEGGGEVTPTPAPEVEEIEEPEQPQVGHKGSWALINLIASLLGLLAALFLIFAKHSKEDDDEEDQNQTVAMNEEDPEQLKRKRIYKWISGLTAVISVIVFVLTENMRLPMVLVDKWTLLMVVFFLINAVTLYLGRKWHEDEDDEEQTQA